MQPGAGYYRIFKIAGVATTVSMVGLTIANGYAYYGYESYGGGIWNGGTLTLTNCTVSGNQALGNDFAEGGVGGGIYNTGTLTLTNSTVSSNSAHYFGYDAASVAGGIYNTGTLTVSDSTISDNSACYAGGIYNGYPGTVTLTLTNSTVSGNSACYTGGIRNFGTLTLNNSTVSGNASQGEGGGIYTFYSGPLTLNSSTVSGNSAGGNGGGGIYCRGEVTLNNSSVSGNSAGAGGGIYHSVSDYPLTLNNSTISGNSTSYAGGIYNEMYGLLQARNTIIAGNTGTNDPDLYGNLGSLGHNLIGNTQGGSGFDLTDLLNVDPLLGPLQNNGGPTFTMALLPGSPAIDAGDNTNAPDWDQRGEGFPRIVNGIIDLGAFEVQDGGSGPGRTLPPRGKPVHLDVAPILSAALSPSRASSFIPAPANASTQGPLLGQEVAVLDRLFGSLNKGDTGFALNQMRHNAQGKMESWLPLGLKPVNVDTLHSFIGEDISCDAI